MGGIFVSYRRTDSAYIAGRLRDDLAERFGADLLVFRDIETRPLGPFPVDLRGLAVQQAVELPDARWDYEVVRRVGSEAPVRLTVDKVESRPDGMRFHLEVHNATTDELFLPWDAFEVTDDAGRRYVPAPSPEWGTDVRPGTFRGVIDVGEPLHGAARVLEAGWVRALGTFEVGSLYVTIRLRG